MEERAQYITAMPPERRAAYERMIELMESLRQSGFREWKVREKGGEFLVAEIAPERKPAVAAEIAPK